MASRKDQDSAKWMRPLGKDSLSSDRFIKPTLEARRAYEESRYTPNEEAAEAPKRAPAIVISQTEIMSNIGSAPNAPATVVPGGYVPQAMQRNAGAVSAPAAGGAQMANAVPMQNTVPSVPAVAVPVPGSHVPQAMQRNAGAVSAPAAGRAQMANAAQTANTMPMQRKTNTVNNNAANGISQNASAAPISGGYRSQAIRRSAGAVNSRTVDVTQAASGPQSANIVPMPNTVQTANAVPMRRSAGVAASDKPEAPQSLSETSHSVRDNALQARQAAREAAKNEPSESSAAASMGAAPRKRRSRLSERNANQEEKPVSLSSAAAAPVHDTRPPAPPQIQPITPVQPDSHFYQAEAGTPRSEKPDLTPFESETPNEADIAEDEDELDAVPSEQMAQPAPVRFGDVQPPPRKRSVIWGFLVAVVLLAAAALSLLQTGVLSKLLGKELPKLPPLFPTAAQETANVESTIFEVKPNDALNVTNFTADKTSAVAPAVINFSVRTDATITDIRLLNDGNSSVLIDSVIGLPDASGKLWEFSVSFSSAFSGDVRVYVRDNEGVWQASSASMTLNIR